MKYNPRFSMLVLTALVLAATGLAQPVMLPTFSVDQWPSPSMGTRNAEGVSIGKDGRFVVIWRSQVYSEDGVLGQRFSAAATPVGVEMRLDPYSGDSSIARDASGRFVIVWNASSTAILGRRFAADGTPLGDSFPVNAWTTLGVSAPSVASDPSGNFVVTWSIDGDVRARRFDTEGTPLVDEFRVHGWPDGTQGDGRIAMSPNGFVITWRGDGPAGFGIYGRRFDPSGAGLTDDFRIDAAPAAAASDPDIAMSAAGDFVAVWKEGSGTMGRRFDTGGSPLGVAFPISATSNDWDQPHVASDSAGNFLVVWAGGGGTEINGRHFDSAGDPAGGEFQVIQSDGYYFGGEYGPHPSLADNGSFVVAWTNVVHYGGAHYDHQPVGRKSGLHATHWIDMAPGVAAASEHAAASANGIFEPGETQTIHTAWTNETTAPVALSGTAPSFTGPAGATYTLNDGSAHYGSIPPGYSTTCLNGDDCYSVTVSAPAVRPVQHWDASLQENLSIGVPKTWMLHIGESFADVPTGNMFYASIETLFHNGVTGGCLGGGFCPAASVSRAQMAVFLLKSKFGAAHVPPPCTGAVFTDVSCTGSTFDPWIEELAALGVTSGCGGELYCPGDSVTREQMAVFLLKSLAGSGYMPPACIPRFEDVPCSSDFAAWINDLAARGVTGGCSATPALYCPTAASNRGQMAVFLTKVFGLLLYGG